MMCFKSQSCVSFRFVIKRANLLTDTRLTVVSNAGPSLRVTAMFVQVALVKRLYETVPSSRTVLQSS